MHFDALAYSVGTLGGIFTRLIITLTGLGGTMNRSSYLRFSLLAGISVIILVFVGVLAAEGSGASAPSISVCANKSTGTLRKVTKCSSKETKISVAPFSTTVQKVSELHRIPQGFGTTTNSNLRDRYRERIYFPSCPSNAPALIGNYAFIPSTSNYKLDMMDPNGYQEIRGNGFDPAGTISTFGTATTDRNRRVDLARSYISFGDSNTPEVGPLEIYLITTCVVLDGSNVINH